MARIAKWRKYDRRRRIVGGLVVGSYTVGFTVGKFPWDILLLCWYVLAFYWGLWRWNICPIEVVARIRIVDMPIVWRRLYGPRKWWAALLYGGYVVLLLLTFIMR